MALDGKSTGTMDHTLWASCWASGLAAGKRLSNLFCAGWFTSIITPNPHKTLNYVVLFPLHYRWGAEAQR